VEGAYGVFCRAGDASFRTFGPRCRHRFFAEPSPDVFTRPHARCSLEALD
jgi:hypothetical protein